MFIILLTHGKQKNRLHLAPFDAVVEHFTTFVFFLQMVQASLSGSNRVILIEKIKFGGANRVEREGCCFKACAGRNRFLATTLREVEARLDH